MTKQKVSSYNKEDELNYISENCHMCKEELIIVEDIWVGREDNNYYCTDCKEYNKIDAVRCREIY